MIKVEVFS